MPTFLRRWQGTFVRVPRWSTLRRLGASRLFRSAYVWIVVVPIAARFLKDVNDTASITIFGHAFTVNLDLPFSWKVFFFASLFVAAANAVYVIRCPGLIRNYVDYRAYLEAGRTFEHLRRLWELPEEGGVADIFSISPRVVQVSYPLLLRFHRVRFECADPGQRQALTPELEPVSNQPFTAEETRDLFWGFSGTFNVSRIYSRLLCTGLYTAGLLLGLVVLVQNIWFVLQQVWGSF